MSGIAWHTLSWQQLNDRKERHMQYGFVIEGGDPLMVAELTQEAEAAGWDGVFIADAIAIGGDKYPAFPWYDPWITLTAMALRTERIRIGTLITPVSRRRPWKLVRETVTLDHLSNGRLTLGVGLGAAKDDGGFCKVGEAMDLKVRAERLDEGLEIMNGLWSGKPFSFSGEHYRVDKLTMLPTPVQSPRIPVWVVGVWQKQKSMRRALRWDGIIPQKYKSMERVTPAEVREMKQFIDEGRERSTPFDIVVGGTTSGKSRKQAEKIVRPFADAGAAWWLESSMTLSLDRLGERIKKGPPRLE
jgi:alkanesulfonate monooxygenase SsuD/methylene tetrahydromethanopterin reductase-like flavin-dependent oxidoreductase (luciferase family)